MTEENPIHWEDESQLIGYGESDSTGAWLKFRVLPEDLELFRGLKGQTFQHRLIMMEKLEEHLNKQATPKGDYSEHAKKLHTSGFFRAPKLWEALHSDEQYKIWVQRQKCICCGQQDWLSDLGEFRCESAHVLRADLKPARQGPNPNKPPYSRVPLCNKHHVLQHRRGESALYAIHILLHNKKTNNLELDAKEWFRAQAMRHVETWAHEELKNEISAYISRPIHSLTAIYPTDLYDWAKSHGLEQNLPRCYKEFNNGV